MSPIIKTRDKAEAEAQQRQYYWSLTPQQRLALALRLNQHARQLAAASLLPQDGRRLLKSATPIPRRGR